MFEKTLRFTGHGLVVLGTLFAVQVRPGALFAADGDFSDGITVDSTADAVDAAPGDLNCADALDRCTLRAAIQEANLAPGPQLIQLAAGTYSLSLPGAGEDLGATGDLDITDAVTVTGAGVTQTTIDANGLVTGDRALHLADTSGLGMVAVLQGLQVTGGRVLNENGGGILLAASEGGGPPLPAEPSEEVVVSLTLDGVKVTGNLADSDQLDPNTGQPLGGSGGGIYSGAALILVGSEVSGNTAAANGGGLYSGGVVTLSGSLVSANTAEGGGGIFETGSHISSYSSCAIVGNTAVGGGGLSSRGQTTLQFLNCTLDGNAATDVGGGVQTNGTVNLVYSTVTANDSASDAPSGGGGLNTFAGGSIRLWSSLVAGNRVAVLSTPVVRNCGCTGGPCTPMVQFLSLGHNLEDADTCGFDRPGDQPSTEPNLQAMSFREPLAPVRGLAKGSPAIEAGDPSVCPAVDQRGVVRPVDGDADGMADCDIGAFEFELAIFADGFETGDTSAWTLVVGLT